MSFDVEKLYALLPAIYRIRDVELAGRLAGLLDPKEEAELQDLQASVPVLSAKQAQRLQTLLEKKQRGPLKALLSIIAEQVAVLEEDLDQLYDDLFIETCAEWVVPYIGDLVGTRGLFVFPNATFSQRAQVANTLAYRRRKGTAAVLEQLARDVTEWDASVVEYFQWLVTTQYMNHLRPSHLATPDLRRWEALERIETPFDRVARTADVRLIESRRGKYNIPNVGIFLWRLGSFSSTDSPAFRVDDRRYLFDALGKDTPLYNRPESEDQITRLAEPVNVPMPLSRRVLDRYLDTYYGTDAKGSSKSILLNVKPAPASPPHASPPKLSDLIQVCDLSDLKDSGGHVTGWAHMPQDKIAIDPVLGRIAFPQNQPPPQSVHVTYHYGFSAEMGGGEYGRAATFGDGLQTVIKVPSPQTATIQAALEELATRFAGSEDLSSGVIVIENNEYYVETPVIKVPAGKAIELRAADNRRPILVLRGALLISGGEGSEVTLNGLLISGGALRVPLGSAGQPENKLRQLRLRHCTLVPGPTPAIKTVPAQLGAPRLFVEAPNVIVELDRCISGALRSIDEARVRIRNSIIDAGAETEVAYAAPDGQGAGALLEVENSTIIGKVHTFLMESASNTIFLAGRKEFDVWPAPVLAERLQQGCVRFSYVPPGARVPRQYHCQPQSVDEAARVRPTFTSLRYGDAGYCQLSPRCAVEIRQGADDQAEMGAFHDLYQPQREANLRVRLDEYLRFGLEAGIFYAS